jgi:hypothetical protein
VESWSPGGVHLESVGEGKLHASRDDHGLVPLNSAVHSAEFLSVWRNHIGLDTE